jgi:hypothetical protein
MKEVEVGRMKKFYWKFRWWLAGRLVYLSEWLHGGAGSPTLLGKFKCLNCGNKWRGGYIGKCVKCGSSNVRAVE